MHRLGLFGVLLMIVPAAAPAAPPDPGDTTHFADVPPPGYPEGVVLSGGLAWVSTPASLAFGFGLPASRVFGFDVATGELERTLVVEGEDLNRPRGLVGMAADARGRLYVSNVQEGLGILRLDPATGAQELYATFADLAPCPAPPPCSPTLSDRPPFPNDLVFDVHGNLYVSDSMQATVWRVPPGGGDAEVWIQHPRFDQSLGANGVRVSPDNRWLYVAVTNRDLTPQASSGVYRVPLVEAPASEDVELVRALDGGPDGLAFGASGRLYVTLYQVHQVVVLDADGEELARFPDPLENAQSPHPMDAPASLAFVDSRRSVLVANHALLTGTAAPERFDVLEVFVDDVGAPLRRPNVP